MSLTMKKFCPGFTLMRTRLCRNLVSVHAFTLIELLVVMSIIGILFSIGIAGYSNFNRKQILTQAVKTLKSDLRLAQSKASSGEKDYTAGCTNSTVLEGWFVSFLSSPARYEIYGKCGGIKYGTKNIDLPSGVTFIPMPSPNPIQFLPLARGVSITSPLTITLKSNSGSQTVTISPSGDIN
ncbi:MAG: prepilin-type N-terminal cleavage/methylation domain-containing protein [bacterium]|nr:prepilin-type N-terminal cleavage/methylation domain-containing protein [bacterium]